MRENILQQVKIGAVKRIYLAASLPEAHLLLHSLQAENIEATVFNENAQGGVGELPVTQVYPEVWIERAEDETRARLVVRKFESNSVSVPDKKCRGCGEVNPSTFEVCWQCASLLQ